MLFMICNKLARLLWYSNLFYISNRELCSKFSCDQTILKI